MPANGNDNYGHNYVTANRFYVEMESTITASFSECSGLAVKIKREALFEGGVNDQQRIIVGQAEFSDITLKSGITDNSIFWNWISQLLGQSPNQRRNINILLFNQAGETMQCWTLIGAIPIGWKAPALQANANSAAIEELTIAYEGLKIQKSAGGGAIELSNGRDKSGFFSGKSSNGLGAVNPAGLLGR
jgi:phage tail-like protein